MNTSFGNLTTASFKLAAALLFAGLANIAPVQAQSLTWGADMTANQNCAKCSIADADMKVHPTTGNAVAVWVQNDGVPDIVVSRFDAAAGVWRNNRILYNGVFSKSAERVQLPQLGMDANGNAVAVWSEAASRKLFYAGYRASDATWSAPAVLHTGGDIRYLRPIVNTDPLGNVFVQWTESNGRVLVKRFNAANRTWSGAQTLVSDTSIASSHMAVDAMGNAIVMWVRGSDNTVHFSRFNKSLNQWSTPRYISRSAPGASVQVVIDRNGDATGVWTTGATSSNYFGRVTATRYLRSTNTWSAPRVVQTSDGQLNSIETTVDGRGNVFIVWGQSPDYTKPVKPTVVRYNVDTAQWTAPKTIETGLYNALWFRVAADANGNAALVWSQMSRPFDGSSDRYFKKSSVRYNAATGSWGSIKQSGEVAEAFAWALGMDSKGRALTLYTQDSGYRWNGTMISGLRANRLSLTQ